MLQTDGGYLGSDFEAFFSAVVSGAAGVYVGVLLQDAGIETDLVVRPGQRVSVSGDPSLPRPPRWGGGGFEVQQRASLSLRSVGWWTVITLLWVLQIQSTSRILRLLVGHRLSFDPHFCESPTSFCQ